MPLQAVFFDMDDTVLAPRDPSPLVAFKETWRLPKDQLVLDGISTKSLREGREILEAFVAFERELSESSQMRPGMREVLARLRQLETRLARLAPKPPAPASDLSARRVWSGPDVDLVGDVSRDGRYMTFVDWSVAGNVMLRDMSTGESRPLTSKKTWLESIAFAEWSRIAPDGRRVAYTWFTEDWRFELRLTDVNGATPRILLRDDEISYVRVHDWSPDSSQLLVMIDGRGTLNQMALVNAADGRVTTAAIVRLAVPRQDGVFARWPIRRLRLATGGRRVRSRHLCDGSRRQPAGRGDSASGQRSTGCMAA